MAWSSPMTAVTNEIFTAAQFNQFVRDNLLETAPAKASIAGGTFYATGTNAIEERPPLSARVQLDGTQSIPDSSTTKVEMNTVIWDHGDLWDDVNFEFVIPAGENGIYMVNCGIAYASDTTGTRWCDIESDARRLATDNRNSRDSSGSTRCTVSVLADLSAGATIHASAFQSSGGSLNVDGALTTGNITFLDIVRVAAL